MNEIEKIQKEMWNAEAVITEEVDLGILKTNTILVAIFKILVLILRFMISKG